jgi:hypothetical protein
MRIELAFERNTAYVSGISSERNIHLIENRPVWKNLRNICTSWKKTMYVRRRSVQHIVSL